MFRLMTQIKILLPSRKIYSNIFRKNAGIKNMFSVIYKHELVELPFGSVFCVGESNEW